MRLKNVWLTTHRKDPLGLRARQDEVFKNRAFGRVGNFLPLWNIRVLLSANAPEKQKTAFSGL